MENQPLQAYTAVEKNQFVIDKYNELKPFMDRLKDQEEFLISLESTKDDISVKLRNNVMHQSINSDDKEFLIPIMKNKIKITKDRIKVIKKELKKLL